MHNKKLCSLSCGIVAAIFAVTTLTVPTFARAQAAPRAQQSVSSLVQGTVTTTTGAAAGTFSGILKLTNFSVVNNAIQATGQLTGTITNLDGTTSQVSQTITTLLGGASGSCSILTLNVGAIHLNVLGLVVDLSPVNLNITAHPGAGNLLGNLLCDVAGLLNGGGPLSAIVADLNSILAAL